MKINLYYEFSSCNESSKENCLHIFNKLSNIFIERNPNITFCKIERHSKDMVHKHPWDGISFFDKMKHASISNMVYIIENAETKKYFVIGVWDKLYWEIKNWSDLTDKCVEVFAPLGMHIEDVKYTISDQKYTPLNLFLYLKNEETLIDDLYYENLANDTRKIPERLFFQSGSPYLFRNYIHLNDKRFDSHATYTSGTKEWLSKLSQNKINIDINCVAEVSNRTPESLGLGTVLLRPKPRHQFHTPLIANYHYVAVEHDKYDDETMLSNYEYLADAYISTFEKIKHDKDYLDFISKNGREYFDKNIRTESWLETTYKLINLDKLR